MPDYRIPILT